MSIVYASRFEVVCSCVLIQKDQKSAAVRYMEKSKSFVQRYLETKTVDNLYQNVAYTDKNEKTVVRFEDFISLLTI